MPGVQIPPCPQMAIVILIGHLVFAAILFFLTLAFITGAPFVPSTKTTAAKMIQFAHIRPGMKVYDLGAGDGRLLFLSAQKGASAVGLEINPFLVLLVTLKIWLSKKRNAISIRWQNFWRTNLADADVVFVYLLPWKMKELQKKLTHELKPGTRIVSNSFVFPGLRLKDADARNHVYLFII